MQVEPDNDDDDDDGRPGFEGQMNDSYGLDAVVWSLEDKLVQLGWEKTLEELARILRGV